MATKLDPREYIDPKRTLRRREEEAESDAKVRDAQKATGGEPAPRAGDVRFGKGFSKEDLAEQDRKLKEMLRKRGA